MNYQRIYDEFIQDRLAKQSQVTMGERHHIVPRCLGGDDQPSNLVMLSFQDHLFAHIVLAKIHGGKLAVAAVLMLDQGIYRGRKSRLLYNDLRQEHRKLIPSWSGPAMMGNKNFLGRSHKDSTKLLISEKAKARHKEKPRSHPPQTLERMRDSQKARRLREKESRTPIIKKTRSQAQLERRARERASKSA